MPIPAGSRSCIRVSLALLAIAFTAALAAAPNQWTRIGPEGGQILLLAVDPQNPSTLYAESCAGIFTSLDAGATWTTGDSGLPLLPCPGLPVPSQSFVLDPSHTGTAWVSAGCGIYKTTDGGANWTPILRSTSYCTNALMIDSRTPPNLYRIDGDAMFKTTDDGSNWTQIRSGAQTTMAVDPQNPDTLYAAGASGLFSFTVQSPDSGSPQVQKRGPDSSRHSKPVSPRGAANPGCSRLLGGFLGVFAKSLTKSHSCASRFYTP